MPLKSEPTIVPGMLLSDLTIVEGEIVGLNDESFSVAVSIDAKEKFVMNFSRRSELFAEQVRAAVPC
jgi:hypothetical protein